MNDDLIVLVDSDDFGAVLRVVEFEEELSTGSARGTKVQNVIVSI